MIAAPVQCDVDGISKGTHYGPCGGPTSWRSAARVRNNGTACYHASTRAGPRRTHRTMLGAKACVSSRHDQRSSAATPFWGGFTSRDPPNSARRAGATVLAIEVVKEGVRLHFHLLGSRSTPVSGLEPHGLSSPPPTVELGAVDRKNPQLCRPKRRVREDGKRRNRNCPIGDFVVTVAHARYAHRLGVKFMSCNALKRSSEARSASAANQK